jgi:dihydrofolate reductase
MPSNLVVDLFISVDGWAGSDGLPAFFGYAGPDLAKWIETESTSPQIMLMGRRTYGVLAGLPEEFRDEGWWRMSGQEKRVFSRTLTSASWPNTTVCSDLIGDVRTMKADSDVPLRTIGSLSIVRQLMEAGLVDRLRLMIFPLLAGASGREAAFEGAASADLQPVGHQLLDGSVLLVEYVPTGKDIPRS